MSWVLIPVACMSFSTALFAQDDGSIDEIVTYGISTGAKQAIGLQKQSTTLVTIISEETLDSLPDQSIGDILARLPGVGVFKDRGEAERIFIRGTDARLNAVTMNGDRLPSPESTVDPGGGQRHARMTTIPAALISEIRVYKAVPPNLDGDSIGGAVQFKTKSATQLTDTLVNATVRWGVNDLNADDTYLGLSGSPTKVKAVTNIIFTAKESKVFKASDKEIDQLMQELIEHHNIG